MTKTSANLRGAIFMMISMGGFALNDAAMKAVLVDTPLFTAIFWRGLVMVAVLGAACWATGAFAWRPRRRDVRLIGWRGLAEIVTTLCFLSALANMPIANATAILQSTPLVVTLAAALILGETVGWRRITASLVGFAGVLIIIRPGTADFNAFAVLAVVAVVFIVVRDLVTHRLSSGAPTLLVAFITSVLITGLGAVGGLATGYTIPSEHAILIAAASGFLILGYVFSVSAMRTGDISFVSPFRYTILVWALAAGILVFDEVPDAMTIAGTLVIVITGLFTFLREQKLARQGD